MADDNVVQQILEGAHKFVAEKRAEGWTQQDFARELGKFFDENSWDVIRASGQLIIIDSLTPSRLGPSRYGSCDNCTRKDAVLYKKNGDWVCEQCFK